ncbi:ATP-dependent helicase [Sporanaerobium hydrogeniformans]|uniref:ATP-dependent helicase n=1 Tax=Sporanaerobium hydrogeniformans TaxID=3072179 RepID=A0AC61D9S4_9FIRM|nr:ATP-dependent DNA helicase [Sporanaerobium hydrogeniformans]PHV70134.1 ATP-dependent helicase [Sporanaerobium hydrogeniformans]
MRLSDKNVFVSVRDLIEFVLKQGNLDSTFVGSSRAVLGTKAHKKLQKEMGENYRSEVALAYTCTYEDLEFVVEGRADGIIQTLDLTIVDEIKSTTTLLHLIDEDYNLLHWAQAKCYAFMYASENTLQQIGIQLTYYHLDTKETKRFLKILSYDALKDFFEELTDRYILWIKFYMKWCRLRDQSLKELTFPFESYRSGQRELAVNVYKSILKGSNLFVHAPTGIGKTISTLFPSLKAMGEGQASKIFYITAKTITRTVAEQALLTLFEQPLHLKAITLTAKEKICFCETVNCTPSHCLYAEGHFDRVNAAIWDALQHDNLFTRPLVEHYAKKHRVCPFEFALDLALWVDVIICDYNYIFDPSVALKRFLEASEYVLLIDEAHNLVDRARSMYTATLSKKDLLKVKRQLPKSADPIKKVLNKINSYLHTIKQTVFTQNKDFIHKEAPHDLYFLLRQFINLCDKLFHASPSSSIDAGLLQLYFDAYFFIKILDIYDKHYITYAAHDRGDVLLTLFCMDPSYVIGELLAHFKAVILFSATLLPIDYYKYLLGQEDTPAIRFDSPFDKNKVDYLIAKDISTRYQDRRASYSQICLYIKQLVDKCSGNYFVFFPSYHYLNAVYEEFVSLFGEAYVLHKQSSSMDELERDVFLSYFEEQPSETHIGFCVLGGIYSEGIDLKYDRLIGVIIIGVGLPQICLERSLIENYFNSIGKNGYHYAYTYPGINKVFQAAGRLIRTEQDRGTILLIDDRFTSPFYQSLFPPEWKDCKIGNKATLFPPSSSPAPALPYGRISYPPGTPYPPETL